MSLNGFRTVELFAMFRLWYPAVMTLSRYILKLWLVPFLGGLIIVMSVLLLSRAMKLLELISDSASAFGLMFEMLIYASPYFLLLTVPMAFLLAAQSVVSGLQQSSELDAIRASGISYLSALRPMFAMALLLWLTMLYLSMEVLPQGQLQFNNMLLKIYNLKGVPKFSPDRFNELDKYFTLYFRGEESDGWMKGVILEDSRPGANVYYTAEKALIRKSGDRWEIQLRNGNRFEGGGKNLRTLSFKEYSVSLAMAAMGNVRIIGSEEHVTLMRTTELWKKKESGDHPALIEWHRRLTLASLVLVFALFIIPLSVSKKRSGKSVAYIWGVALILLMFNSQIAASRNALSGEWPWWSMWVVTAGYFSLGVWLLIKAERDTLPSLLTDTDSYLRSLFQTIKNYIMLAK